MKKQSHTVPRRRQSASPASRHLPLVDILIDAQAELQELRSGPRNLDSGLSEISIVFQAAVPKLVASKYTTSGVRRPSEL